MNAAIELITRELNMLDGEIANDQKLATQIRDQQHTVLDRIEANQHRADQLRAVMKTLWPKP